MGDRITFSGLSTGIDFQAIVDVTILAEQRRIDLVIASQVEETARLTAVQSFNGLLLGLLTSTNSRTSPRATSLSQPPQSPAMLPSALTLLRSTGWRRRTSSPHKVSPTQTR